MIAEPETQYSCVFDEWTPVIEILVISVEHGTGRAWFALQDLTLAAGHTLDRAEALEVRRAGIRDRHDIGLGKAGQVGNFTSMIGA